MSSSFSSTITNELTSVTSNDYFTCDNSVLYGNIDNYHFIMINYDSGVSSYKLTFNQSLTDVGFITVGGGGGGGGGGHGGSSNTGNTFSGGGGAGGAIGQVTTDVETDFSLNIVVGKHGGGGKGKNAGSYGHDTHVYSDDGTFDISATGGRPGGAYYGNNTPYKTAGSFAYSIANNDYHNNFSIVSSSSTTYSDGGVGAGTGTSSATNGTAGEDAYNNGVISFLDYTATFSGGGGGGYKYAASNTSSAGYGGAGGQGTGGSGGTSSSDGDSGTSHNGLTSTYYGGGGGGAGNNKEGTSTKTGGSGADGVVFIYFETESFTLDSNTNYHVDNDTSLSITLNGQYNNGSNTQYYFSSVPSTGTLQNGTTTLSVGDTINVTSGNSLTLTYTPNNGTSVSESFSYYLRDPNDTSIISETVTNSITVVYTDILSFLSTFTNTNGGTTYILQQDISDFSGTVLDLVANDVFDGNNYTIDLSNNATIGLFSVNGDNVTIKNLGVVNGSLIDDTYTDAEGGTTNIYGGYILQSQQYNNGYTDIIIRNCYTTGNINISHGGGIVGDYFGSNGSGEIAYCYSKGDIESEQAGGIAGRNCGYKGIVNIHECYSNGAIYNIGCGGIVGLGGGNQGEISIYNCYSTGDMNLSSTSTDENNSSGGIAGSYFGDKTNGSYIYNCYYSGNFSSYPYTGGIVGSRFGYNNSSSSPKTYIYNSYSNGQPDISCGTICGSNVNSGYVYNCTSPYAWDQLYKNSVTYDYISTFEGGMFYFKDTYGNDVTVGLIGGETDTTSLMDISYYISNNYTIPTIKTYELYEPVYYNDSSFSTVNYYTFDDKNSSDNIWFNSGTYSSLTSESQLYDFTYYPWDTTTYTAAISTPFFLSSSTNYSPSITSTTTTYSLDEDSSLNLNIEFTSYESPYNLNYLQLVKTTVTSNGDIYDDNIKFTSGTVDLIDISYSVVDDYYYTVHLKYIPNENYNGSDTFTYYIYDSSGNTSSSSQTISFTINSVDDNPTLEDDKTLYMNEIKTIDFSLNIVHSDTTSNTFVFSSLPSIGTITYNGSAVSTGISNGISTTSSYIDLSYSIEDLSYTLEEESDFTFYVEDNDGNVSSTSTIIIHINYYYYLYSYESDISGDEDTLISIDLSGAWIDPSNTTTYNDYPLSFYLNSLPSNGNLYTDSNGTIQITNIDTSFGSINSNGTLTIYYLSDSDYNGSDSFNYYVKDNIGGQSVDICNNTQNFSTVSLTINSIYDGIVLDNSNVIYGTIEDVSRNFDICFNSIEDSSFQIVFNTLPINGSLYYEGSIIDDSGNLSVSSTNNSNNYGINLTYYPNTNYFGTDIFTYYINDTTTTNISDTGTVNFNIVSVYDDILLTNSDLDVITDEDVSTNLSIGFTSIEDGSFQIVFNTLPSNGSLFYNDSIIDDSGNFSITNGSNTQEYSISLSYDPSNNYFGNDSFSYYISDVSNNENSSDGSVNIIVNGVYDDITLDNSNISVITNEDVSTNLQLGFTSIEDGSFQIVFNTLPSNGSLYYNSLIINDSGNISINNGSTTETYSIILTYDPSTNYFGNDSFSYYISDVSNSQQSIDGNVNIIVDGVYDDIELTNSNISFITDEDVSTNLQLGFTSIENGSFQIIFNTLPQNGSLYYNGVILDDSGNITINNGNSTTEYTIDISYIPSSNYFGNDSFSYYISDVSNNEISSDGTVNITVDGVYDDIELINSDISFVTSEDTSTNLTIQFTSLEDGSFQIVFNTLPSNGSLLYNDSIIDDSGNFSINNGSSTETYSIILTYDPSTNYFGNDSFSYYISDVSNSQQSIEGTVNIIVDGVYDDITLTNSNLSFVTDEDVSTNLQIGFTSIEDGSFQIVFITLPSNGSLYYNGLIIDDSGNYSINNGSSTMEYTIDFSYNPSNDYFGNDSFSYYISDVSNSQQSIDGSVNISVEGVYDDITLTNSNLSFVTDEDISTNLTIEFTSIEDGSFQIVFNTLPSNGSLLYNNSIIDDSGNFSITNGSTTQTYSIILTYEPSSNYFGSDSFSYYISDVSNSEVSSDGSVNFIIISQFDEVNLTTENQTFDMLEDESLNFFIQFTSVDDTSYQIFFNTLPSSGYLYYNDVSFSDSGNFITSSKNSNETYSFEFKYIPGSNFVGEVSFNYYIQADLCNNVQTEIGTTTIDVYQVFDDINLVYNNGIDVVTLEDTSSSTFDIKFESVDDVSFELVFNSLPTNGSLYYNNSIISSNDTFITSNSNNNVYTYEYFTYEPSLNYNGTDTCSYYIRVDSCNNNISDNGTIDISVVSVYDEVILNDINLTESVFEDTSFNFTLTFTSVEDNSFNYVIGNLPNHGTLYYDNSSIDNSNTLLSEYFTKDNPDLSLTFLPNENYFGSDSFTYYIYNETQDVSSSIANVTYIINGVYDNTEINNDTFYLNEDSSLNFQLSFSSIEDHSFNYVINTLPSNGTLYYDNSAIDTSGIINTFFSRTNTNISLLYIPDTDYFGSDSFEYYIYDASENVDSSNAIVTFQIESIYDITLVNDSTFTLSEDSSLNFQLSFSSIEDHSFNYVINTLPSNGTLYYDNSSIDVSGIINTFFSKTYTTINLLYIPNTNYFGYDAFEYYIYDSSENVDSSNATVTFQIESVYDVTIVNDSSFELLEDASLSFVLSFSSIEDHSFNYFISSLPNNGTLYYDNSLSGDINWVLTTPSSGLGDLNDTYGYYDANSSVTINYDGTIIAKGIMYNDTSGTNSGAVQIYYYTDNSWSLYGNIINNNLSYNYFGMGISLDGSGNRIIISSPGYNSSTLTNCGALYIYDYNADINDWELQSTIEGSSDNDLFGLNCKINYNGNIIVADGYNTDSENSYIKIYEYNGSEWLQQGNTVNNNYSIPSYLYTRTNPITFKALFYMDFNNNGDIIIHGFVENNNVQGKIVIYGYNDSITDWQQCGTDICGNSSTTNSNGDYIGYSVSLVKNSTLDGLIFSFGQRNLNYNTSLTTYMLGDFVSNSSSVLTSLFDTSSIDILDISHNNSQDSLMISMANSDRLLIYVGRNNTTDYIKTYKLSDSGNTWLSTGSNIKNGTDTYTRSLEISRTGDVIIYNKYDYYNDSNTFVYNETNEPIAINTSGIINTFFSKTNTDISLIYVPNENYFGYDTFEYYIYDASENVDSNSATVTFEIEYVYDTTIVNDSTELLMEDASLSFSLTFSSVEDHSFNYVISSLPTNGTLYYDNSAIDTSGIINTFFSRTNTDISLLYIPNKNYFGYDTFEYYIYDASENVDSSSATVTFQIEYVYDVTIVNDSSFELLEDTSLNFVLSFSSIEDHSFNYVISTLPNNGTLYYDDSLIDTSGTINTFFSRTNTDISLLYIPNENYFGYDTFEYFIYDASENADSSNGIVTFEIEYVYDKIIVNDSTEVLSEDASLSFVLSFSSVEDHSFNYVISSLPSNGTLYYDNSVIDTSGIIDTFFSRTNTDISLIYIPDTNYFGYDTIEYYIYDTSENVDSSNATVTFEIEYIYDTTIVNDSSFEILEDASLSFTLTFSSVEDHSFNYVISSLPSNGTLYYDNSAIDVSGIINTFFSKTDTSINLLYIPNTDYFGSDSFEYYIYDSNENADSSNATVSLSIEYVYDDFYTEDSSAIIYPDVSNSFEVSFYSEESNKFTYVINKPTSGYISYTSSGYIANYPFEFRNYDQNKSLQLSLTNVPYSDSSSSFTYYIKDQNIDMNSNTSSYTIFLDTRYYVPKVYSTSIYHINENTSSIIILKAFTYNDNLPLKFYLLSYPSNGTLYYNTQEIYSTDISDNIDTVNSLTLELTYIPTSYYYGNDEFDFYVEDQYGNISSTSDIKIIINNTYEAPVVPSSNTHTTFEDLSSNIILTFTSIEDNSFNYVIESLPVNGTLYYDNSMIASYPYEITDNFTQNESLTISYVPNDDYYGSDTFDYYVIDKTSDPDLDSNLGTVNITITNIYDIAIVDDVNINATEDVSENITLQFITVEDSSYNIVIVSEPSNGNLYIDSSMITTYPYTSEQLGVNGTITVTYLNTLNYYGSDEFNYYVVDLSNNDSNIGTVTVTIQDVNDFPFTYDLSIETTEEVLTNINLYFDSSNVNNTFNFVIENSPDHGILYYLGSEITSYPYTVETDINEGEAITVEYQGTDDYFGTDAFQYYVKDIDFSLNSNISTVYIDISNTFDEPVSINKSVTVDTMELVDISLAAFSPDDLSLNYYLNTLPTGGSLFYNDVELSNVTLPYFLETTNSNSTVTIQYKLESNNEENDEFYYYVRDSDDNVSSYSLVSIINEILFPYYPDYEIGVEKLPLLLTFKGKTNISSSMKFYIEQMPRQGKLYDSSNILISNENTPYYLGETSIINNETFELDTTYISNNMSNSFSTKSDTIIYSLKDEYGNVSSNNITISLIGTIISKCKADKCKITKKMNIDSNNKSLNMRIANEIVHMKYRKSKYSTINAPVNVYGKRSGGPQGSGAPPKNSF
jgi:hypothetical protein